MEKQRIWPNADNFKLTNTVSDCYQNYKKVIKRMPHQNGKLRTKREFDKFNDIMYKLYHTTECGTDVTFTEAVATWACQANSQFIDEQLIKQSGNTVFQIQVLAAMQMKFKMYYLLQNKMKNEIYFMYQLYYFLIFFFLFKVFNYRRLLRALPQARFQPCFHTIEASQSTKQNTIKNYQIYYLGYDRRCKLTTKAIANDSKENNQYNISHQSK
ncbi:Hypothetical_protein [Hexamita inflata]|uniref:Hypothetical_protein n=1 Tax=Hexamita inflata TaxID=28002 RepID=A0AA86NLZ5_9EUKA|nr:Hypothetical protein HINF_LOCUS8961 [Hexamita inflata]